ncbi:MAG: hypothetical protein ACLPSW_25375 [Roseiarcus sp.]
MQVTEITGTMFKHSLSSENFVAAHAELKAAGAYSKALGRAYANCVVNNDALVWAFLQKQLLKRREAALASIIHAARKLPLKYRPTLDECLSLAPTLGAPSDEIVYVRPEPKKSGGFRAICRFGPINRAKHDLVARAMAPHFKPREFQHSKKGIQFAIAKAKEFGASGFVYAARLDIGDFFGSFELEKLASVLPLPKEVVEYAVMGQHLKLAVSNKGHGFQPLSLTAPLQVHLLHIASRGIPTGAASSAIIALFIVSLLAWSTSAATKLLNWADDFLIFALTPEDLEKEIEKLVSAVAELPGGHFNLKLLQKGPLSKGITFLGHDLRLVNGVVRTRVAPHAWEGIVKRLNELDTHPALMPFAGKKTDPKKSLALLAKMLAYAKSWRQAFSQCDDAADVFEFLVGNIEERATKLGFTMKQVENANGLVAAHDCNDQIEDAPLILGGLFHPVFCVMFAIEVRHRSNGRLLNLRTFRLSAIRESACRNHPGKKWITWRGVLVFARQHCGEDPSVFYFGPHHA